jgi:putative membrane protein insertion efficiency factor
MSFPSVPSVRAAVAAPVIWLIRAYQLVWSPMRPQTCRFYPSCSAYALTALERFGLLGGSWLAARRLLRCHPWNPGGVDHVPHREPERMSGRPTRQT